MFESKRPVTESDLTFAESSAMDAARAISYPKKWKHKPIAITPLAISDEGELIVNIVGNL